MKKVIFYSCVEDALFMKSLWTSLASKGYQCSTFYQVSAVRYSCAKSFLSRFILRIEMYVFFPIRMLKDILSRKNIDYFVFSTNPFFTPFLGLVTLKLTGARAKSIFLLWDLYPEALAQSSTLNPNTQLYEFLSYLTKFSLENADRVIFIGEYLRRYVNTRYGDFGNSAVIPVGADGETFLNSPPKAGEVGDKLTILYSGNFGKMHDSCTLVDALNHVSRANTPVEFKFVGGGSRMADLKQLIFNSPYSYMFNFNSFLETREWRDAMLSSDMALITIASGAESIVMPSKSYSAMMAGQALLAICEDESDLSALIKRHDCGWVVRPGDSIGFARLLESISKDPDQIYRKRRNSFCAGHAFYAASVLSGSWSDIFFEA
jgi:colanic acid biosynthesis glycosyl transferase WcaI